MFYKEPICFLSIKNRAVVKVMKQSHELIPEIAKADESENTFLINMIALKFIYTTNFY